MKVKLIPHKAPIKVRRPSSVSASLTLEALREAAVVFAEAMKDEAPGTMGDAVEIREPKLEGADGTIGVIKVVVNDIAAKFVIEGTDSPIVPTEGEFLSFRNKEGERIRIRSVEGQPANDFPQRARNRVRDEVASIFRQYGLKLLTHGGWGG